jgi:2-oxoisovalerate dehydrogenase E2 component (dihydrolipoyl transacylase)
MGTYAIKLPDIGEGTAEAELVEWSVKVGDEVAEDEIVAAVMTDKATIEIPSSSAGKVVWLGAAVGDKIAVGGDLLRLEVRGPAGDQDVATAAASTATSVTHVTESILRPDDGPLPAEHPEPRLRPLAAPVVRRIAREAGIDLKTTKGSGPAGRILRSDLAAVMERPQEKPRPERPTEEVKIAGLRRIISERMAASVHQAAHFSYVEEVEVEKLEDLRAGLNARNGDFGSRLTLLPFLLRAISVAIDEFPQMNAHFHADRGSLRVTAHFMQALPRRPLKGSWSPSFGTPNA